MVGGSTVDDPELEATQEPDLQDSAFDRACSSPVLLPRLPLSRKRRVRRERKEAKALHAGGKTAEEIPVMPGQKQEIVAAWLEKA